jgi:hypothetical protein
MPDSPDAPSLRFFYSADLHRKAITLLDAVEQTTDPTRHSAALGDLAVELTDAGLDYYFVKPLAAAGSGFLAQQSAAFGMSSAARIMSPFTRRTIGGMDKKQLLTIAGYIRHLMR